MGIPESVDPAPLTALWSAGLLPVVSPVCGGPHGEPVNVNADEAALALARRLRAESMVYLSDADGVRAGESTLESLSAAEARRHIEDGTITGGMSLKVRMALAGGGGRRDGGRGGGQGPPPGRLSGDADPGRPGGRPGVRT